MNQIENALYIVSTPIGNLEDITLRALNILKNVDVIACEDTRRSLKLLNHYEIKKKLITYHSYNEKNSCEGIINLLSRGKSVALISDGGTPLISDPGFLLINKCRELNFKIISIPGPSSIISLLSVSGFRTDKFIFLGFLSTKKGKLEKELELNKSFDGTIVLFESPYRLLKTLESIGKIYENKKICIGKELTKINEKIIIGDYNYIINLLKNEKIVGEYTILIANY